jgi:diaminopimelate epimerase
VSTIPFVKMEGAGNDYIFVDGYAHPLDEAEAARLAVAWSDRHKGIGGDGLILLMPSRLADCRMLMWNADGTRGAMCGNGIRCLAKLAYEQGRVRSTTMTVESDTAVHEITLSLDAAGAVVGARVDMGRVTVDATPVRARIGDADWNYLRGDAGNPHAVVFVDSDLERVHVRDVGAAFQELPAFPGGVNVEFVRCLAGALAQRTYERGSGETQACGSGATVAALAAWSTGRATGSRVEVRLRGGTLVVHRAGSRLVLEGPARTVFAGEVPISERSAR